MGGLAALAREAGHRVTGCDAGVYPPMSDQLRALGIELIEGFGADQLAQARRVRGRQRGLARPPGRRQPAYPLMEAILDAGKPYTSGPQWLAEHVLQARHVLAVAGTHGKTTTTSMLAWILEHAGLQARLPGRRRAAELRRVGPAGRRATAALRDRGRRVRHRLLRQAQQVRALPAAHRRAEQPGVRPRRHLRRPGGHRAPVPPPGAHRAGSGRRGGQRAGGKPAARAGTRAAGARCAASAPRSATSRAEGEPHDFRRAAAARRVAHACSGNCRRRAQPAERAGRHRRGRARRRAPAEAAARAGRVPQRQAPHGSARRRARGRRHHGVRRLRPPPDRHPHHARRPAPQAGRRRQAKPSASWRCSSRAATR
jgi:hypothetical protein